MHLLYRGFGTNCLYGVRVSWTKPLNGVDNTGSDMSNKFLLSRVAFVSYFALRSVNRIIKIIFLINFAWMDSLSEILVTMAAIITTLFSVLGKYKSPVSDSTNYRCSGACVAEYFYREKYSLWHIGQNDRSAYLYNLTGREKLQIEATNFTSAGVTDFTQISDNLLKFHVIILFSLQSIYLSLQWKKNSSLHLQYKSILGRTSLYKVSKWNKSLFIVENISNGKVTLLEWFFYILILLSNTKVSTYILIVEGILKI